MSPCPSCGTKSSDDAAYCAKCGRKLDDPAPPQLVTRDETTTSPAEGIQPLSRRGLQAEIVAALLVAIVALGAYLLTTSDSDSDEERATSTTETASPCVDETMHWVGYIVDALAISDAAAGQANGEMIRTFGTQSESYRRITSLLQPILSLQAQEGSNAAAAELERRAEQACG